jgi:uncharacterized protein (DUF362 family)
MNTDADRIAVAYGDDPRTMVPMLLDYFCAAEQIPKNKPVGIKPNLVVSKPSSSGATTDPKIVESIIVYLQARGILDIVILESAWIGDDTERAFDVCGYTALKEQYGIRLLNLENDMSESRRFRELSIQVCKQALGLGYLINVPVLKAHCQTKLTCALKNLKGLIPPSEKRRFHELGLHTPIAYLNKIIKADLTIVDGIIGDLSFEEGGNPVRMNRIFAGHDPVLIDAYAATLLGYAPSEIEHVKIAAKIGVGSIDLDQATIEALNQPDMDAPNLPTIRQADRFLKLISQDRACSACVGSIIHALNRLNKRDNLSRLPGKIHVGQGYKERALPGIGIGACTRGFAHSIGGCPPRAVDIRKFIESILDEQ